MKTIPVFGFMWLVLALCPPCEAQIYDTNGAVVQTFAGSGFAGYVDGVGQLTMFNNPNAIVADSSNNLFVLDTVNYRVRKIAPDGTVTTFAGGGIGSLPGFGTNVCLNCGFSSPPWNGFGSMAIDRSNVIWIPVYIGGGSAELVRIGPDAYVSAITTSITGLYGSGICVDSANNIYYPSANRIYRRSANGALAVFAGSGNPGYADGNGIFTAFNSPTTLAADAADNIYVWDLGNALIRRIDQSQNVTTFAGKYGDSSIVDGAGTNAGFNNIYQMGVDGSGNLLLAGGACIRKISATTNVVTIAGTFSQAGYTNGAGNLARFNGASGVCVSGGTIYVADSGNQRIRSITNNPTAQPVSPANLQLSTYPGLQIVGTVGRTYQIESSPDMTNWTARATLLLASSPYLWIDHSPVNGSKFYRALLLP